MFYASSSVLALGAISLLASAGHAGAYRGEPPNHNSRRQAPAGFVEVPLAELQMLQSEYTTFHGWIEAYLSSANATDPQTAQLTQDVQAYDEWISIFLGKYANGPNPSAAAATVAPPATPTAAAPYAIMVNGSTNSSFNAQSSSNLAVYYGQSPATEMYTLEQMCQDDNVDIVVLAFLTTFYGPAGQPVINFGPATGGTPTLGAQKISNRPTGLPVPGKEHHFLPKPRQEGVAKSRRRHRRDEFHQRCPSHPVRNQPLEPLRWRHDRLRYATFW